MKNILIYIILTLGFTSCFAQTDESKAKNVVEKHWKMVLTYKKLENYEIIDIKKTNNYNYVVVSRVKFIGDKPYLVWITVDGSTFERISMETRSKM